MRNILHPSTQRGQKFFFIPTLFFFLFLAAAAESSAQCNSYEPNNNTSQATVLFNPPLFQSPVSVSIFSVISFDDQDWYKIPIDGPGTITANLTSLPKNYNMELYGVNGLNSFLAGSYNSGTTSESIVFPQPNNMSTIWYIKIYGATPNENSTSCYNLTVSWSPPPCALASLTPQLVSPGTSSSPGTTISGLTPTLDWNNVTGASGYGVYIRDMNSNTLVYDHNCITTSSQLTVPPGILVAGRTYRWNVKAHLNCGTCVSLFSSALYFTTQGNNCTPPTINSNPADQTVAIGQSTSFSVNASGTTLSYQWEVNTGSSWTLVPNSAPYSGTTSATLNISAAVLNMNGYKYRCTIINSCGNGTSGFATLTVTNSCIPAGILTNPVSQNITAGQSTSFSVNASGTNPSYQWEVNTGSSWANVPNNSPYSGANAATLNISSAALNMNGYNFRCRLTNTCGNATSGSAMLTVTNGCVSPAITSQPVNQTVAISSNTSFSVTASGTSLNYQWQLSTDGGTTYNNLSNNIPYAGATTPTLTLTGITLSMNNNKYRCQITNSCGNATSNAATLSVTGGSYTITGFVRNVRVNVGSRTIELPNYPGCTVNAYIAGTNTLAGTDVSDNNGHYQISVTSLGTYDIKATDNSAPANSVKLLSIAGNSAAADIKIPAILLQQVAAEKNHLTNWKPTISSLGMTAPFSFGYQLNNQNNLIFQWRNIISDYTAITESAARLYTADSVLHLFYQNADKLNDQLAISVYELAKAYFTIISFMSKATAVIQNLSPVLADHAVEALADRFYDWITNKIDQWVASLPSDKYFLKIIIKNGLDRLRHDHTLTTGLAFTVLQPIIESIFATVMIGKEYIQLTQPSFDYAALQARTLNYSGTFQGHFNQTMLQAVQAWQAAEEVKIAADYHLQRSKIISTTSQWVTATAGVTTLTPLAAIAGILRTLAFAGEIWSAGELTISTTKSIRGFYSNIEKVQPAVASAFRGNLPAQNRITNLSVIDSMVTIYNNRLTSFKATIVARNYTLAAIKLDSIVLTEAAVQKIITEAMIPVKAATHFAYNDIPEFDSVLFSKLRITTDAQPMASFRWQMCGLSLLADTTHTPTKDSLILFVDYLKQNNLGIRAELEAVYSLIAAIPAYNYIQNVAGNIPFAMEKGQTVTIKIKYRNFGPVVSNNTYAKIEFDSPFTTSTDSIYLGNLAVDKIDSISFTLTSPLVDTVASYHVSFFSPGTISEGFAGVIRARSLPVPPAINYNLKVCFADTLKLFANSDEFGARYQWSGPNGFASQLKNPTIPNIASINMGAYSCVVTSDGLKSTASTTTVSIIVPNVIVSGNLSFCQNSSTTLTAGGASIYRWSNGAANPSITITSPGTYTVTGESINGCKDTKSVQVLMSSAPVVNLGLSKIIYQGERIFLGSYPPVTGAYPLKYKWTPAIGLSADTVPLPVATPVISTVYTLKVTDRNGCSTTKSVEIIVIGFYVSPNPTAGIITVKGSGLINGNYVIKIHNTLGQLLIEKKINVSGSSMSEQIDMYLLPPQLYYLTIENGPVKRSFKIVRE